MGSKSFCCKHTRPLKVGDRVIYRHESKSFRLNGLKGTVICPMRGNWEDVGVCFDEKINGHDLGGRCKNGHGFWASVVYLTLMHDEGSLDYILGL